MNKNKIRLFINVLIIFLTTQIYFAQKIEAPANGCYHAAFVGSDLQSTFEQLAGKNIAIEMFFTGWPSNKIPDFPESKCNSIVSNGAIPHITWMFQVSGSPFPLDAIINGSYDSYITGYANQVKNWGKQLFIRAGHEMNGDWYTYGGQNNGGGTLNGFGDPNKADGPERFIAAYRHIVDLFNNAGVTNVTWVWCPNNGSSPNADWNTYDAYYPGDEYVDWVGMDGYNFGTSQSWSAWVEFFSIYNSFYQAMTIYNKPIMIAEYASVEDSQNINRKANWITSAYTYTKAVFKKIKAITWFHIKKYEGNVQTDWRINSSTNALTAYQTAISDNYFLGSIVTNVREENQSEIPDNFLLLEAYPNPFGRDNTETTLKYSIPNEIQSDSQWMSKSEKSKEQVSSANSKIDNLVMIKVYDILGREISTLVNEYKTSGIYEVKFDSKNLSSGVYFAQLLSGGKIKTIKLLIQK